MQSHGEMSMRAILFTEELMGVALKFSRKSANMGSLWVSWEPGNTDASSSSSSSKNRKNFTRRVQATISLCLATVFFTIFLFFVCVLDSSSSSSSSTPWPLSFHSAARWRSSAAPAAAADLGGKGAALQGLGVAFRWGTRSMSELVVAHVAEDLAAEELRLFLRTLHRSGVTARADVVLLFPGDPRDAGLAAVVEEEDLLFKKLMLESGCIVNSGNESSAAASSPSSNCAEDAALQSNCSISRLNLAAFERAQEESRLRAEAALAKQQQQQGNASVPLENQQQQQQQRWLNGGVGWGSIMGFEVSELDPTDTLSGFVDRPPVQLRRWVCYHMLLGMARHRYKQVMVTQVRGVLVLGDGLLAMARKHKDGRALVLVAEDRTWLEEASSSRRSPSSSRRDILSKAEEEEDENVQDDPEAVENWESTGTVTTTRRSSDSTSGSRKKKRKSKQGMIEAVYGKQVWSSIESEDKAGWALVSGAVVAGGVRGLRSLADAVATEVARVAMMRRSRRAFGDQAVLNYVVRRNAGVLGRKVMEKMLVVGGADAHALLPSGGGGGSAAERILEQLGSGGARYSVVVAGGDSDEELRLRIGKMVAEDLCSSPRELVVYRDCEQEQEQLVV